MNPVFKVGDKKIISHRVTLDDAPTFVTGTVHEVYSSYAIARDAEWTGRQFVLEMKDEDEEGIGTLISVHHHSAAFIGEEVMITATLKKLHHHEIIVSYEATVGGRLIATGETGQKILKRDKLHSLFSMYQKKNT